MIVQCIWNYRTNLSNGVSVLFNKNVAFILLAKDNIEDGRVISLRIEINDHRIQIINIYAPNNFVERKRFYQNMRTGFDDEYAHILAGDFNCTQDNTIDRKPKSNQNDQVFQELDSILKQFSLEDIFHKRYPRKHAYTFTRGLSKFRIYYFCISTLLDCYMDDASIHYFPFSDHDAVVLDINLNKSLNGPGIWKINAQTIQTHVFRELLEKLWPTWTDKINEYENILIWWEIAKIHI